MLAWRRMDPDGGATVLVACNFTPVPWHEYRVGMQVEGQWREILITDAETYGGSGMGNMGSVAAAADPSHGLPASLALTLPPAAIALQVERRWPSRGRDLRANGVAWPPNLPRGRRRSWPGHDAGEEASRRWKTPSKTQSDQAGLLTGRWNLSVATHCRQMWEFRRARQVRLVTKPNTRVRRAPSGRPLLA